MGYQAHPFWYGYPYRLPHVKGELEYTCWCEPELLDFKDDGEPTFRHRQHQ